MPPSPESGIEVTDLGHQNFTLTVIFEGQRFDCGTYVSRAAAMQAGKLFLERKEGERLGRRKRPRKKS